ncbi:nitrite reductase small subunit NirD [Klebsiella variicola subsp. variicola]|nr:nitrite reductase small subunit NirD [Klebsiella variicola subsp. variicola]
MSQWVNICKIERHPAGHRRLRAARPAAGGSLPSYQDDRVFAISNIDPFFNASVLSRGIIGEHDGALWVTSPLKKQRFRLSDGLCMEDASHSIARFDARVKDGQVQQSVSPLPPPATRET